MNKRTKLQPHTSFLSRIARFVRHPTTDWAQTRLQQGEVLDKAKQKTQQREAQWAAQAAILVRNREFDILRREMRNRHALKSERLEGLSLPSTLPPPAPAATRQHTLHKIDAIERQMKNEQRRESRSTLLGGMIEHSGLAHVGFAASTLRPGSLRRSQTPRWAQSQLLPASRLKTSSAPATRPQGLWGQTVLPIPAVIELAAFDFAEGRDAQVESHLLTSLQTEQELFTVQQLFQALLDFYWATGQQDKLQSRSLDYVQRYGQTPLPRPELDAVAAAPLQTASFLAAEQFDILQWHAFERFVADPARHLVLDWSALIGIAEPLQAELGQALQVLNDRPVELELHGEDMLLAATRLQSSPATAAQSALRLQALRLVGDEAGFADLAVELSIACACSPVDWVAPRFKRVGASERGLTTLHSAHQPSRMGTQAGALDAGSIQTSVRLSGKLSGKDATFLRNLRAQSLRTDTVYVDLQAVQRVDFAAATDLLNWVEAQTHLGKSIELRGAHTLLVPFLQSVGLQVQA